MSTATHIAILSLAVATLAAAFSLWSSITAHRAHKLAVSQNDERGNPLRVYMADAYGQRDEETGNRRYAFLLSITNSAAESNTVSRLELRVHFRSEDSRLAMIDIPSDETLEFVTRPGSQARLVPPIHLAAGQSVSGWVTFKAASTALAGQQIDLYEVRASDVHDRSAIWKAVHIKEVHLNETS